MTTYQIRRYELDPDSAQEFVDWVVKTVIPLREAMGFKVQWRYLSEDKTEFTWLVSLDASASEFEARDKLWMEGPERAQATLTMPISLKALHTKFVSTV